MRSLAFMVLLLASCNGHIAKDLDRVMSKPVTIPTDLLVTFNGIDTVMPNRVDVKMKLVIYFDSKSCSSCEIDRGLLWRPLIEYAKQFDGQLRYYFIFNSEGNKEHFIKNRLRNNPINYPIFIDENGVFERLNPLLSGNKMLHTLLVDANNNIILVGNPLYNKKVETLFYQLTQETLCH